MTNVYVECGHHNRFSLPVGKVIQVSAIEFDCGCFMGSRVLASVEELAAAIHRASGVHSITPMRAICDRPLFSGHMKLAERILEELEEPDVKD